MKIYVVRHGQTDWNVKNRLQGNVDVPLNTEGIIQARNLSTLIKNIDFDVIFSSPLSRALDTAKIINKYHNVDLQVNDALLERNYGSIEGIYGNEYDKFLYWDYEVNCTDKNVESIQHFFDRIYKFIDYLKKYYSNNNILLVTHSGVNIAINCYFNGLRDNLLSIQLDNCSYIEYEV